MERREYQLVKKCCFYSLTKRAKTNKSNLGSNQKESLKQCKSPIQAHETNNLELYENKRKSLEEIKRRHVSPSLVFLCQRLSGVMRSCLCESWFEFDLCFSSVSDFGFYLLSPIPPTRLLYFAFLVWVFGSGQVYTLAGFYVFSILNCYQYNLSDD